MRQLGDGTHRMWQKALSPKRKQICLIDRVNPIFSEWLTFDGVCVCEHCANSLQGNAGDMYHDLMALFFVDSVTQPASQPVGIQ